MDVAAIQLLSETLLGPVSSVLTGVLGNWLFTKILIHETEKSSLLKEFDKAFTQAVTGQENDFHELLQGLPEHLDCNPKFARATQEEFTACLKGLDRYREPSVEPLWSMYCQTTEDTIGGLLEKKRFHLAISALWYVFRRTLEGFPKLRRLLLDQYEAAEDGEQVGYYEAHKLMKIYCRVRLKECDQYIPRQYRLGNPPKWLTDVENVEQFCTYRPVPPMFWEMQDGMIVEEQPVDDVFALPHRFVIYTGIGGVGKTRFFEEFERIELEKQATNPSYPDYLPIRLTAEEIGGEGTNTAAAVTAKIEHSLRNAGLDDYQPERMKNKARALAEYLRVRNGALLLLVDGFDQVASVKEQPIVDTMTLGSGYGLARCAITTRPCRKDSLCAKTKGRIDDFAVIRIEPFSEEMIENYFGPYFQKVEHLTGQLKKRDVSFRLGEDRHQVHREVHFLQIPLLARYLKAMTIYGGIEGINNKADLFQQFVNHIEGQQAAKFNLTPDDCRIVFRRIEELALHLLAEEQGMARIEFSRDQIDDSLRDTQAPAEEMQRFDLLRPIFDGENRPFFRFQHQLLQEFLAARCLWRQYRRDKLWREDSDMAEFFRRIEAIKYDPDEVAEFLALLISTDNRLAPEEELLFWHERVVMNQELDSDWVRTYGLQIRDAIADQNKEAAAILARLFSREQAVVDNRKNMIEIPGGMLFVFGSYDGDGLLDERPVRLVTTKESFSIDRFPVTNLQFCDFLNARFPGSGELKDENDETIIYLEYSRIEESRSRYTVKKGYTRHPVIFITWYGAKAYCAWRSEKEGMLEYPYRLPTEAEWEQVARGRFGRRYPWGNEFAAGRCNTSENNRNDTSPVGEFISTGDSPYGCVDMAGNVLEWTDNVLDDDGRIIRGGSWFNARAAARCAYRLWLDPGFGGDDIGFRCARTIRTA